MRLDLPDPVGPTKAKSSVPSNSTTVGSRNAVKPATSIRFGRIKLLEQFLEQAQNQLIAFASLLEVHLEQVDWRSLHRFSALFESRVLRLDVADSDLHCVWP